MKASEEGLLREYERTIELFLGESRIAWQLVSIWVVVQVGLGSAVALFYTQQTVSGSFGYLVLLFSGMLSNLAWIVIQYRAKMWRENWLLYGLRLEKQLHQLGINVNIFGFEQKVREKMIALEYFDSQVRERDQRLREKFGALRISHFAMLIVFALWLILLLASLFGELMA